MMQTYIIVMAQVVAFCLEPIPSYSLRGLWWAFSGSSVATRGSAYGKQTVKLDFLPPVAIVGGWLLFVVPPRRGSGPSCGCVGFDSCGRGPLRCCLLWVGGGGGAPLLFTQGRVGGGMVGGTCSLVRRLQRRGCFRRGCLFGGRCW